MAGLGDGRGERAVLLVVAAALAILFLAQPVWRGGDAAAGATTAAIDPAAFEAKVAAMVAAHATGEEEPLKDGSAVPVVRPPPGDVFVLARRWHFHPALALQAGRTYRVHVASADILHGFHLGGVDVLLAPGQAASFTLTPRAGERLVMQCSEYCGIQHNAMVSWVRILGE